jgi:transposase
MKTKKCELKIDKNKVNLNETKQKWFKKKISNQISLPSNKDKVNNQKLALNAKNVNFKSNLFSEKVKNNFNFIPLKVDEDAPKKTTKLELYFNKRQRKILKRWIIECKKVYNKCVEMYKKSPENFDLSFFKSKLKVFENLYKNEEKPAPYDMLTDEVKKFCSSVKSNFKAIENKTKTHFNMKFKPFDIHGTYSILIPKNSISKKGIFVRYLGIQKKFTIVNVNSDCRLLYNLKTRKIQLCYLLDTKCKYNVNDKDEREEICSIDPGEKVFITYYTLNGYGMIGEDIRKPILKIEKKIRRYQRIINKGKSKNGGRIKHKKSLWDKIRNLYKKIHNLVEEMQNKVALYLCRNYKRILMPSFNISPMIKKEERLKEKPTKEQLRKIQKQHRLNKRVKFVLSRLSPYKFQQKLKNKCLEYGSEFVDVTEEFTSKTCTKCGEISDKFIGRKKVCEKCNFEINRDIGGSRNILIKNIKRCLCSNRTV